MRPILLTLLLLTVFFFGTLQAQERPYDVVFLKNGQDFKGEILRYEQGKMLVLRQADGLEIEVKDADIQKIVQSNGAVNEVEVLQDPSPITPPRTDGFYNSTFLAFAMGKGSGSGLSLGAGLHNVLGKMWSPRIGTGLGLGVDNYARRGETVYPVFLELRTLFPAKKQGSYYAALGAGYGFAFKRKSLDITEATGGLMVHPVIGYRVTTDDGTDVNFDLGVKFQDASFSRLLFNGDTEIRTITYKRLTLRIGLTLWK